MDKGSARRFRASHKWALGGGVFLTVVGAAVLADFPWHRAPPSEDRPEAVMVRPERPAQLADTAASSAAAAATAPPEQARQPMRIPDDALATIPWKRYPSGMQAAADMALQGRDGKQAFAVAKDLQVCQGMGDSLRLLQLTLNNSGDAASRQLLQQQWKVRQQDAAFCQAVPGDLGALRARLLAVAVEQGMEGSGTDLALAGQRSHPAVMKQVLKEMESGHDRALALVGSGLISAASPLQVAAARDAIVRGAHDPDLEGPDGPGLAKDLDFMQRQATVDAWKADPQNTARLEAARKAWTDNPSQSGTPLAPSTDPQVRVLADQYLMALKKRHAASRPS